MDSFDNLIQLSKRKREQDLGVGTELNATINFRVNSELKKIFEDLCKANHSTVSQELKKYMSRAVISQRIT